jgi:flagellar hook assembly protein FlgD
VTVGVEAGFLPASFALRAAGPNPFRDGTAIEFDVPAPGGPVELAIYDVRGRLLRSLVNAPQAPGTRRVQWDGRDGFGQPAPAGVYLCRMRAPGYTRTQKLTLAR